MTKYYKILDQNQHAYGLHGPIHASSNRLLTGDCIYTANQVLNHMSDGEYLYDVVIREEEVVVNGHYNHPKHDNVAYVTNPREYECAEVICSLIKDGFDPKWNCSYVFRMAAGLGNKEMITILFPYIDPYAIALALDAAARKGRTDIVKIILPHIVGNIAAFNRAFYGASFNGHIEVMNLLFPYIDKSICDSAFRDTIYGRQLKAAKIIYPYVSKEMLKSLNADGVFD